MENSDPLGDAVKACRAAVEIRRELGERIERLPNRSPDIAAAGIEALGRMALASLDADMALIEAAYAMQERLTQTAALVAKQQEQLDQLNARLERLEGQGYE